VYHRFSSAGSTILETPSSAGRQTGQHRSDLPLRRRGPPGESVGRAPEALSSIVGKPAAHGGALRQPIDRGSTIPVLCASATRISAS